ncbi:MAG: phage tail tip lysozyme [Thalassovita sp.]
MTAPIDVLLSFRADASQSIAEIAKVQGAILGLHKKAEDASRLTVQGGASGFSGFVSKVTRDLSQATKASAAAEAELASLTGSAREIAAAWGQAGASSDRFTTSLSAQVDALMKVSRENEAWQNQLNQVRAQFNPIFAASQQYETQLRRIAEAQELGAISEREAAQARASAAQIIAPMNNQLAENARLARGAGAANAYYMAQFNDIGMMALMGQNPVVLALQQGPQMNQMTAQLGGGQAAFSAMAAGAKSMLNPMSLATIGIIGLGAAGVQAFGSITPKAKSLQEVMGELESTVDAYAKSSDRARMSAADLTAEFGSASQIAKDLLTDIAALDRRAAARSATDGLKSLASSQGVRFGEEADLASSALGTIRDRFGLSRAENKTAMGIESAMRWAADAQSLESQVKALEVLHKRVQEAAELHGGISKEEDAFISQVQTLLDHLTKLQAQDENASGRAEIKLATADYEKQAALSQTILQHGENSREVEALRNRQAREALMLRLDELGIEEQSAEAQKAIAALEAQQVAKAREAAAERARLVQDNVTTLNQELGIAEAILRHGEGHVKVERLRTEHAKNAVRTRLKEAGVAHDQIEKAVRLLSLERERRREIEAVQAQKKASDLLGDLQREAQISQAILKHGRDSLQVKRLQIAAAREEFELQLKSLKISESMKGVLRVQWEATHGQDSADPFGRAAAAQQILKNQTASNERLKLEVALVGQSEAVRRRVLTLYEAEVAILERGIDAGSSYADQIRAQAVASEELRVELARQAQSWDGVHSAAEGAIDGATDALLDGDLSGALDSFGDEIKGLFAGLAIKNPLKNAILGTNYGTLNDVGGLQGIWGRLTGQADPNEITGLKANAMTAAAMSITTPMVTLNAGGISGAGLSDIFSSSNTNAMPGALTGAQDVQKQVWDFFTGKGLRPHQVGAIMGNVAGESGFNPVAKGDNGTSFGLFQHHGPRGTELLSRLGGVGGLGNVQGQLEHVWQELLTSENGAFQALLKTTNVSEATDVWMRKFERPSDDAMAKSWADRLSAAEAAMTKFTVTTGTASQGLGTLGSGFDTFGQALMQNLSGGSGSGSFLTSLLGAAFKAFKIPGFAKGGNHTGGVRIVGEQGPELEVTGPSTIIPTDLTRQILTARQGPMMTAAPTNVTFAPVIAPINNSSSSLDMQVRETTDARGQRRYELVLSDMTAAGMSARGGKTGRVLGQKYGLRQNGINRG